jgi:hypothetical protein
MPLGKLKQLAVGAKERLLGQRKQEPDEAFAGFAEEMARYFDVSGEELVALVKVVLGPGSGYEKKRYDVSWKCEGGGVDSHALPAPVRAVEDALRAWERRMLGFMDLNHDMAVAGERPDSSFSLQAVAAVLATEDPRIFHADPAAVERAVAVLMRRLVREGKAAMYMDGQEWYVLNREETHGQKRSTHSDSGR